jgi:hypothetical protein
MFWLQTTFQHPTLVRKACKVLFKLSKNPLQLAKNVLIASYFQHPTLVGKVCKVFF